MTANEFNYECVSRTIMPEMALENEKLVEALRNRDDETVRRILDEEF